MKQKQMPLLVADVYELAGALRSAGERIAATQGQTQARWQVMSVITDDELPVPRIARAPKRSSASARISAPLAGS